MRVSIGAADFKGVKGRLEQMFCLDLRGIFSPKYKFPRVEEQVILMERRLPLALFTLFPYSFLPDQVFYLSNPPRIPASSG